MGNKFGLFFIIILIKNKMIASGNFLNNWVNRRLLMKTVLHDKRNQ